MRRLIALAALCAVPLAGCRWVAVGDSILSDGVPQLHDAAGPGGYVDAEPWRAPNGLGIQRKHTTNRTIDLLIPTVDAGGWLIVEEAGDGVPAHDYLRFVDRTVAALPDDRCLAFVMPYAAAHVPANYGMDLPPSEEILPRLERQPCRAAVRWDLAAASDPGLLLSDGLHPSPRGQRVLAELIAEAIQ